MVFHHRRLLVCGVTLLHSAIAWGGMPAPLPGPVDPAGGEDNLVLRLSEFGILRVQTISFFLVVFFVSALLFQWLWNWLGRDLLWMKRLTYPRAVGLVFLWSLAFVIVLTMISGARELMTPGAWKKQGFTYKLEEPKPAPLPTPTPTVSGDTVRRQHLEKLRTALLHFAATHQGRFPGKDETTAIAADLWEDPTSAGLRYLYIPGRSAGHLPELLACEPDLGKGRRLVLCANGDIFEKDSAQIEELLKQAR